MPDRLAGVWLLERVEHGDVEHPPGVLVLTGEGWFSMQVGDRLACAGHFGLDGDRFLADPVVALAAADIGRTEAWQWSFDGDVLVLEGARETLRWYRESTEVVTGLGAE